MKKILLIDDDEQVRKVFGLALRREGYHVLEADSGSAGLALAKQHLPDLILSDIHMPGGDGSTLLRDIREDPELVTKQVVLMTGRPDLVGPRRGMEDGADDFLIKPVAIKDLISCIAARFGRASINWRVEDHILARLRSSVPTQLPHEFFTPIAGIIGLMEILRDTNCVLEPDEVRGIHDDVFKSAVRLHRTLRNYLLILDMQSRQEKPTEEIAPLPATKVADNIELGVAEALQLNPRIDDVTMHIAGCSLAVKPDDLLRMTEELVDNACKFSRQGTAVTVELSAEGCLTVTDHGRGMTKEEIGQIGAFQQFERKKQEQQGLGLGLVLVQRLAAVSRADFSLTSQPGEGTQTRILFPKA